MTRTEALIAMALVGCLAGTSLSYAQAGGANVPASSAAPQLSELQRLRAENLRLKVAVTQLRLALAQREAETTASKLDTQRQEMERGVPGYAEGRAYRHLRLAEAGLRTLAGVTEEVMKHGGDRTVAMAPDESQDVRLARIEEKIANLSTGVAALSVQVQRLSDATDAAIEAVATRESQKVRELDADVKKSFAELRRWIDDKLVTRDQFLPYKLVIGGLVGAVLIAFLNSLIATWTQVRDEHPPDVQEQVR